MRNVALALVLLLVLFGCKDSQQSTGPVQSAEPQEIIPFTKKIEADPMNANLYYQRAQAYRVLNMDSMALRDLEKSISIDTTQSKFYSTIGDILFDNKDLTGSVQWFKKAVSIDPNDETAHLKMANFFLFGKEYPKAFIEINAVLRQNVYNAEAYFLKGMCYKDMGEMDRAISSFQTAVQTEPKYYDGFMQLGIIYTKKKDPLALQYFNNAIRVDSMNMEAHYAKAMFHQSQNDFVAAKQVFKEALRTNKDYAEGHYNIGWMLLQQDSTEKARREFERVLVLDPDNPRAYYNRGLCSEILGDSKAATEDYEQALVFDPEFELAITALARTKKK